MLQTSGTTTMDHEQRRDSEVKEAVKDIILPFLPAKALIRFSSVSKEWNQWIKHPFMAFRQSCNFKKLSGFFCQEGENDPTFVSLNGSAYGVPMPSLRFLPEPVDIVTSCNGLLVCHGCGMDELYYVCNPATTEWAPLPKPQLYHGFGSGLVLAFEPSAMNIEGHYQLLCAVPMLDHLYFELYTSITKSWEILNTTVVDMQDVAIKHNGFYMNGVAYLLTNTKKVIAFHLEKGVYEVIPMVSKDGPDGVLTQIQGEACYIAMSHCFGNIYSIMINGGMDLSLKHDLKVCIGEAGGIIPRFKVLPCLDGEKVMILHEDCIYSYSIRDRILEEITRVGIESASAQKHLAYVNSLVQLA
ncbi:hypothetical protein C2S51_006476 [Perilla frutescens var. frutescens]|nr:hypothetical protein C2S51_006476 [Perilla frutescens var. frutescens]